MDGRNKTECLSNQKVLGWMGGTKSNVLVTRRCWVGWEEQNGLMSVSVPHHQVDVKRPVQIYQTVN